MPPPRPQPPADISAPGLKWRERKHGWVAYWIPRDDAAGRQFPIKSRQLWPPSDGSAGVEPSPEEWQAISDNCEDLQDEMLNWLRGGAASSGDPAAMFDDTMISLIRIYETDPDSPYKELRFHTAKSYDSKNRTLIAQIGGARLSALTFRDFKRWYAGFREPAAPGKPERIARAHGLMTQIRIVFAYGVLLELPDCARLKAVLDAMEFENPKRRKTYVTAEQAIAIRAEAHRRGRASIALAQALEFELGCRQKDAIWEWLPISEPGLSNITDGGDKAMHGFHWNNVSPELVLEHRLSKSLRGRKATVSAEAGKVKRWELWRYPMVMEEIAKIQPELRVGAMVKAEHTGLPWRHKYFQQHWREIATAVGVPLNVQNRDSRAGAATEAENNGADVETIRQGLGHSKPDTTRIYTRAEDDQTNKMATLRFGVVNKPGTK